MSTSNKLIFITIAHVVIIFLSNTLVQYPFLLFGLRTTWGAFTYPLIFILTDLTTRLLGQQLARKIVLMAMIPGFICSYLISNYYTQVDLFSSNTVVIRIALASFLAYVLGQLLDISIFQKLRQQSRWWVAPSVSNILGNIFDTYCFFLIAFVGSSNPFLSRHWMEIATVDLGFKLLFSLLSFIPLYGFILKIILHYKPNLKVME